VGYRARPYLNKEKEEESHNEAYYFVWLLYADEKEEMLQKCFPKRY
jgi:hypothetical protein